MILLFLTCRRLLLIRSPTQIVGLFVFVALFFFLSMIICGIAEVVRL